MQKTVIDRDSVLNKYVELYELYKNTSKITILKEAEDYLVLKNYELANGVLETLETRSDLLKKLLETLKHKSVYSTLKKIISGKEIGYYEKLKGLTSMMTHLVIECEHGNVEYLALIDETYSTIGKILYGEGRVI